MKRFAVFLMFASVLVACFTAGCSANKVSTINGYLNGDDYQTDSGSNWGGGSGVGQSSRLSAAYSWLLSNYGSITSCYKLSSDGSFLSVDTNPYNWSDYSMSRAISMVEDLNDYFGLPAYVWNDMLHTSAVDGRQTESYGGRTVTWVYHPDRGLEANYRIS